MENDVGDQVKTTSIMNVFTHILQIGVTYDRPQLGKLWGMAHQSFSRGVFTPSKQKLIMLFVTKEKQECLTQYQDFIQALLGLWGDLSLSG